MINMSIELIGLDNIPLVEPNDDICQIIKDAIEKQGCLLKHGDIILIAETLISKAEGNVIKLGDIIPSEESIIIAKQSKKDSKLVEAIINESREVVAVGPDFIITETKQGFVCANSGIDESNVDKGLATPMPEDADKSARQIREFLENEFDEETGINVYDLTLFLPREDGLYERDEEIHYQKAYDPEKVRELLEKAGLIPLAVYDAYTKDAPKPDSGRLTFVAREHGKEIPSDEK